MDRTRIDAYEAGGAKLIQAYAGSTRTELLAEPIPGTWSLQQIAIHLLESDLIGADRMKRIAAMDRPLLIGYDETAFSQLPGTNLLDVQQACSIFAQCRQMSATVFRNLPDESFEKWGIHNEIGRVTLAEMIDKYIQHLDGHLVHVAKKRALLNGK